MFLRAVYGLAVRCHANVTRNSSLGQARRLQLTHAAAAQTSSAGLSRSELDSLWENHVATEFVEKSADAAVETMIPTSTVNHTPLMTGGKGTDALRDFYGKHFIPKMPPDVKLSPIDRIISNDTVVDEFVFEFTHTVQMDWMLPGIKPTGKKVRIPFVVIVKFGTEPGQETLLAAERIYWDQASVLVQLGLLDPTGLPVTGVEQAEKVVDFDSHPSNQLIDREG